MKDFDEKNDGNEEVRESFDPVHILKEGAGRKLMSLLGFAARGRKLVAGTDICRDSIRRGNAPSDDRGFRRLDEHKEAHN